MRWLVVSAVILGGAAVTAECAAQSPPPSSPPPALHAEWSAAPAGCPPGVVCTSERRWYGWQTLIALGGSLALSGALAAADPVFGVMTASVAVVLAGPVVHWTRGYVGRGFVSLGMNLGLPLLGALPGVAVGLWGGGGWGMIIVGGGVGLGIGLVTAWLIDVGSRSFDEPVAPRVGRGRAASPAVVPDVRFSGDRATFGVVGVF